MGSISEKHWFCIHFLVRDGPRMARVRDSTSLDQIRINFLKAGFDLTKNDIGLIKQ